MFRKGHGAHVDGAWALNMKRAEDCFVDTVLVFKAVSFVASIAVIVIHCRFPDSGKGSLSHVLIASFTQWAVP